MGDRANIVVVQNHIHAAPCPRIWLYSHWGGHGLANALASALARGRSRWGDEGYLARIIFDEMTGGNKGETGYGITTYPTDNDAYPVLVVDCDKQTVFTEPFPRHGSIRGSGLSWSFDEYASLEAFGWWTGAEDE